MSVERIIEISACLFSILLLVIFVPKNRCREAWLIFLFKQTTTWLLGLWVVQYELIEYPVRMLANATRTSVAFEYVVYPSLCVLFNLYFPTEKSILKKFLHYAVFCSGITVIEVVLEIYTALIRYSHWSWYWTWITLFITFYISRKFYLWFFKGWVSAA
ncbi:MAG: hypothetical protein N2484_13570 [Clostridia bacterium]|nr:hypothetical protein [Clostridia bacterium]